MIHSKQLAVYLTAILKAHYDGVALDEIAKEPALASTESAFPAHALRSTG
jgi:hypothetical protein